MPLIYNNLQYLFLQNHIYIYHNRSKFCKDKIAQRVNFSQRYFCSNTKLHKDSFAPRVNFAQVTILHDSKKKTDKKREKKPKDKLIKKQRETKKLLTEGKGQG